MAVFAEVPQIFRDLGVKFRMVKRTEDFLTSLKAAGESRKIKKDFEVISFSRSLRTILLELQAQSPQHEVAVDCSYFAQMASIILRGDLDAPNFFLVTSPLNVVSMSIYQKSQAAYVLLMDPEAHRLIRLSRWVNKGQWLIKIAPDAYLGLGSEGMRVDSEANWIQNTRKDLLAEIDREMQVNAARDEESFCERVSNPLELSYPAVLLANLFRKLGRLEQWKLEKFKR